ncbi:MAG: hypothetical protein N2C12_00205, partial [Planctomycetales bacterium]
MSSVSTMERTGPALLDLVQRLREQTDFAQWVDGICPGRLAVLDGVWGSACALAAAALVQQSAGPLVVVWSDADRLDEFPAELSLFSQSTTHAFPPWESDPGERLVHDEVFGRRLRLLKSLVNPKSDSAEVVVASIQSMLQGVPGPDQLAAMSRRFEVGCRVELDELAGWLSSNGLHRTSAVELPGEFSIRGGIADLFAADWLNPVRLETFGDQIESLREFDVNSQRSLLEQQAVEITILPTDSDAGHHLTDYLPADSMFLLVEPAQLSGQAADYLGRTEQPQLHFSHAEVRQRISRFRAVAAEAMATATDDSRLVLPVQSVERFSGDINKVRDELDEHAGQDEVHVICSTAAESKRVSEILAASNCAKAGRLALSQGRICEGFRLSDGLMVISGSELFHRHDIQRPVRRQLGRAIDSFTDLRAG